MPAATWPCPSGYAAHAVIMGPDTGSRLLIVPALFDEGHKLRRFTLEVMRRLVGAGLGCVLPDLPGLNESLAPLEAQTPETWRGAMAAAAAHFTCSHVLAMRGGCLVAPDLPGWFYAPLAGANQQRQMLRARIITAREAGREETQDGLLAQGREQGLELAGYRLGAAFLQSFGALVPEAGNQISTISQDQLGGAGLWMRAEAGENAAQADALAAIVAVALKGQG
ncbi:hypothetical protein [Novosphingobium umbonatum]|nr:hypothetical protein [Novosphingobium umbonatum]